MRSCDTDESSSRVREDLHLIAQDSHTGIPAGALIRLHSVRRQYLMSLRPLTSRRFPVTLRRSKSTRCESRRTASTQRHARGRSERRLQCSRRLVAPTHPNHIRFSICRMWSAGWLERSSRTHLDGSRDSRCPEPPVLQMRTSRVAPYRCSSPQPVPVLMSSPRRSQGAQAHEPAGCIRAQLGTCTGWNLAVSALYCTPHLLAISV